MVTIVNEITGKILRSQFDASNLAEGEIAIPELPTQPFVNGHINFLTRKFYEAATPQEIEAAQSADVPDEVASWRLRAILKSEGLEEYIETALAQLQEPLKTQANYAWNYGTIIVRNSQTVLFIQSVIQKSKIEVDQYFIRANNISI